MTEQIRLEDELNAFDPRERADALARLAVEFTACCGVEQANHNMHVHSFFSFNALGWSPSRIAWESRKVGLHSAGLCDFDVLAGLEEFLDAGLRLGLRAAVSLETRVFLKEYADKDISSPGEPGVTYIMGAGFVRTPLAASPQAQGLAGYRDRAGARNEALIARVNRHLPQIAIDYGQDVLPLTPAGAPTERHIVSAYLNRAKAVLAHPSEVASFWSGVLGRPLEETVELLTDTPALEESVRSRLAKRGGLGYEQPSPDTFPPVEEFIRWVLSCEAIPMITWLDGTSAGERDGRALLEYMAAKGCVALNIIPDRNWNISDPKTRGIKIAHLNAIVSAAKDMGLPINIGTEMNKLGQPDVDLLDVEALRPHKDTFLRGARILVGQSVLSRYADLSYTGARAKAEFRDVGAKNAFFERVGALPPLTQEQARDLQDMGPEKALTHLRLAAG